jgi:hypothetical protein
MLLLRRQAGAPLLTSVTKMNKFYRRDMYENSPLLSEPAFENACPPGNLKNGCQKKSWQSGLKNYPRGE